MYTKYHAKTTCQPLFLVCLFVFFVCSHAAQVNAASASRETERLEPCVQYLTDAVANALRLEPRLARALGMAWNGGATGKKTNFSLLTHKNLPFFV